MYPHSGCREFITEISKVSKRRRKIKLQDEFLILFAKTSPLSVYQIYNKHKSDHRMRYIQSVRKKIKQLLDSNLIVKVKNRTSKHRAIDYRLSTGGLYHLIYNKRIEFIGLFNRILQHYNQDIVFRILLYPYIQKSSLEGIRNASLISKICAYLYDCCEEVQNTLESIKKSHSRYVVQQVCLWNDVHERGEDNYRLIDFLKHKFNLNWLDNNVNVSKNSNDNIVRLSKGNNWLLIRLSEEKTEATMTVNGKEIQVFNLAQP